MIFENKLVQLSELCCDISYGYTASANNEKVGPKFLRITDIQGGIVSWNDVPYCECDEKNLEKNKLEFGDIVVARTGNSTGENYFFCSAETAVFASYLIRFRIDPNLANPYFVWLQMRAKGWWDHVSGSKSGSAQAGANAKVLGKFEFYLPSRKVQDYVAKIALDFNNKIALNDAINKKLEGIAQALFKSWFVDFDPVKAKIEALASGGSNSDAEISAMSVIAAKDINQLDEFRKVNPDGFAKLARTAALFPAAMQDSEQGEIPVGWEIKQLSEICEVINGRAYKNTEFKTSGTPIVRIQNLSNGGKTVYSDLELSPDKYIESEDFIYAWSATFGPYIWRGPKSIYHYHIWKMEVDESIVSRYFLYLSMFRKTEAMKNAGTGSIFTHLTKGLMESQKILIADNELNMAFSEIVNSLFRQITALKTESDNLSTLRDTLLPELLSGRLAKGE